MKTPAEISGSPHSRGQAPNPGGIIPSRGERALIVGQTGSGKTAFAAWMLKRIEQSPIIIYDTKIEEKFQALDASVVVNSMEGAQSAVDAGESDYIIVRPPDGMLHLPLELDALLYQHYMRFQGMPAYIDEMYSFHNNGRAGKGLTALLTRGRSKGITTIMSTQRPVLISRFSITESQKIYVFELIHDDDQKTMAKAIKRFDNVPEPAEYNFYFYDVRSKKLTLFAPIKLDDEKAAGYIDVAKDETADAEKVSSLTWL